MDGLNYEILWYCIYILDADDAAPSYVFVAVTGDDPVTTELAKPFGWYILSTKEIANGNRVWSKSFGLKGNDDSHKANYSGVPLEGLQELNLSLIFVMKNF